MELELAELVDYAFWTAAAYSTEASTSSADEWSDNKESFPRRSELHGNEVRMDTMAYVPLGVLGELGQS